jgi:hypothetical protein
MMDEPFTDEERAASAQVLAEAVVARWLRAKGNVPPLHDWTTNDPEKLRAYLDEKGMELAAGDPVKGQRIADFNDMIIERLKARKGDK